MSIVDGSRKEVILDGFEVVINYTIDIMFICINFVLINFVLYSIVMCYPL